MRDQIITYKETVMIRLSNQSNPIPFVIMPSDNLYYSDIDNKTEALRHVITTQLSRDDFEIIGKEER